MTLRSVFLAAALLLGGLLPVAEAQSFQTLYSFTTNSGSPFNTNCDGAFPCAGLLLSGNVLYGTAQEGGSSGYGTVFAVNADGTAFTPLYSFTNGGDGAYPYAGLLLSGNTLYGTAQEGGSSGYGTVFAVNTNGTGFVTLCSFAGITVNPIAGYFPYCGLVLCGNTLYGTTAFGGSGLSGTLFKVNTNGTGFAPLYNFSALANKTNSDGAVPFAGLLLSGHTLFGTTEQGGNSGYGTVFKVNTDGTGLTTLYNFTNGSDGFDSEAGLILLGNTLYGTTEKGGNSGYGTVFQLNTNGTGFTTLYNFTGGSDGANPLAGLLLSGNTLYGTAFRGGSWGNGTVFALGANGSGFSTLYSFSANNTNGNNCDGAYPGAGLILSGHTLYGTAFNGGGSDDGTVFALNLAVPISLNIQLNGASVVLSWDDPASVFSLQSAPAVTGKFTNIPGATSPYTNSITGTQQHFRLMAN